MLFRCLLSAFIMLALGCSDIFPDRSRVLTSAGGPALMNITSIVVTPGDVYVTASAQLAGIATDAAGTKVNVDLVWTSGDPSILTVENGVVTGIQVGAVEVTASAEGVTSSPVIVNVTNPVTSIEIIPFEASVYKDNFQQFIALPKNIAGEIVNGLDMQWVSSSPLNATIDRFTGVAVGRRHGDANMMAGGVTEMSRVALGETNVTGMLSDTPAILHVIDPLLVGAPVGMVPESIIVYSGDNKVDTCGRRQFAAQVFDISGAQVLDSSVTWSSGNVSVASVDPDSGLVRGISDGFVDITATGGNVNGSVLGTVTINVVNPLVSIQVNPLNVNLVIPSPWKYAAVATDVNGVLRGDLDLNWSSSDLLVAGIESDGTVLSRLAGSATITASCGSVVSNGVILNTIRRTPALSWSNSGFLPTGLYDHTAIMSGSEMIVTGGVGTGGNQKNSYIATIGSDQTIGDWFLLHAKPNQYPKEIRGHASVLFGGNIFVMGGIESGIEERTQETIFSRLVYGMEFGPGVVGSWNATTPLPIGLFGLTSFATSSSLFIAGGWDGVGNRDEVYSADLLMPTVLGPWRVEPGFPIPLSKHAMANDNHVVYVLGGSSGSLDVAANPSLSRDEPLSNVFFSVISATGSLGGWQLTTPLPIPLLDHSAVILNGYLFVSGGHPFGDVFISEDKVYYAPIQLDGSLGLWVEGPTLPVGLDSHVMLAYNDTLYVVGGKKGSDGLQSDRSRAIYFSPF